MLGHTSLHGFDKGNYFIDLGELATEMILKYYSTTLPSGYPLYKPC